MSDTEKPSAFPPTDSVVNKVSAEKLEEILNPTLVHSRKITELEAQLAAMQEKLRVAKAALLVYANKEHLLGPFAESEPGYIAGKQVTVCRHIGQTAKEALEIIGGG